jgi:multiple sugar transport system substrate-binding protein
MLLPFLVVLSLIITACGGQAPAETSAPTAASGAAPTAAGAAAPTAAGDAAPTAASGAAPTAAGAAAATTDAAPAANGEQIELRIVWWGGQTRHDRTTQVIEMFQKEHPNIKLVAEYGNFDDHWTKLATQAAGGNLPDIVQQDYSRLADWVAQDLMLSLDPYVEKGTIDLSNVAEAQISGGRVNGQLYAVSLGTNALSLIYDRALLDKAGAQLPENYTWADLMQAAKKVSDATDAYGLEGFYNAEFFKLWLKDHGQWLYNKEGTGLGYQDDQLATQFFQMLVDAQAAGATPTRETDAARGAVSPEELFITKGQAATLLQWSNFAAPIAGAGGEGRQFEFALPPQADNGGQGVYLKPSQFFSIAKTSAHPDAAAMFIDYFTNSVEANKVLLAERGVPVSSKIREAIQPELPAIQQKVFDYINTAEKVAKPIDPPDPKAHTQILADVYNPIIDRLMYGEITPQEAATQLREQAEPILAAQ